MNRRKITTILLNHKNEHVMKTNLNKIFAVVIVLISTVATSQLYGQSFQKEAEILVYDDDDIYILPRQWSSDNKPYLITESEEGTIQLYNESLQPTKSFKGKSLPTMTSVSYNRNKDTWKWEISSQYERGSSRFYRDTDYFNLDEGLMFWEGEYSFTQTFFNDDEKIEYLQYIIDETYEHITYQSDYDNDGVMDYRTVVYGRVIGLQVVNEDGSVLSTLKYDPDEDDYDFRPYPIIMKFGGVTYLVVNLESKESSKYVFYRVNKNGNSLQQVQDIPGYKRMVFDLDGRQRQSLRRGVNIVRDAKGNITKMLYR